MLLLRKARSMAAPLALAVQLVACAFWGFAHAENPTTDTEAENTTVDAEEEQHEFDAVTVIVLCGCLFIALAMGYALHKYKFNYLPHSTAAMILGVVVGGVASAVQDPNVTADLNELEVLTFSSEFFFYVLLPPIIFDAGYHFEKKRFFRNFSTITLFAVLGTIISTFIIGFTVYAFAVAGIIENVDATSPLEALLFGSLISAVDPVATLSIMGNPELKCDPTLYSIVFGESVLNDAISIVLFSAFKNFLTVDLDAPNIALVLAEFVGIAVGSGIIGVVLGLVCSLVFKHSNLKALPAYETLILFIMAYGSFAVGEACKLSGVMALFFCGVILSHYNFYNLSDAARVSTRTLFHAIALASETFVFIYMGMCLFTGEFTTWDWAFCVIAILSCLLGRFVNTFGLSLLINACSQCKKKKPKLSCKMQFIIWFAGLRGAIAFALAFTMPDTEGWNREAIVTTTLVVVFFTTVVIGGLTEPVLRKVRVQAVDDDDDDDFVPANTGFSHMDLEFPPTPSTSRRKMTKRGIHGMWKAFDEKHMKKCFGGPKDTSAALVDNDNLGELTPTAEGNAGVKATTYASGAKELPKLHMSVDLDHHLAEGKDDGGGGYTPPTGALNRPSSNSYHNNRQVADGDGADDDGLGGDGGARLSDDDSGGGVGGGDISGFDDSEL